MSDVRTESIKELGKRFELSVISLMTQEQLMNTMQKAGEYNLHAVFVPSFLVPAIKKVFAGTDMKVATAVSFPLGSDEPEAKGEGAKVIAAKGADEIDFVMNFPALAMGHPEFVERECKLIRENAPGITLKMILEVCYLKDDQIRQAVRIAAENGIDFVKSSTGQIQGPTFEQVCVMVDEAKKYGLHTKVAGVKFPRPQNAMTFLCAGVDRIGTQNPFEILDGIQILRDRGIF